jgi:hypothetical protein
MDTIEHFFHSLTLSVPHHFLAIGVTIIVLWLLISGLRKGLKKGRGEKDLHRDDEEEQE